MEVATIAPRTWPTSTSCATVAQQWVPSVHVSPVAADAEGGNAPPTTHGPDDDDGVRVVTRPETTPRAMHDPAERQSTAVTSVVPAGTASRVQVDPPSVVVTMAPGPTPVRPTWPTAVHDLVDGQAMADR